MTGAGWRHREKEEEEEEEEKIKSKDPRRRTGHERPEKRSWNGSPGNDEPAGRLSAEDDVSRSNRMGHGTRDGRTDGQTDGRRRTEQTASWPSMRGRAFGDPGRAEGAAMP